ncbi:hypothetical protein I6I07_24115 [Achromobacter deleyi]|uniref:Uncharacterized protein n=1 Tax=Achromobacter deleyi TaxID=1353891 RepID=A0A7T4E341_9BURK|nr:hypothetical protein [Achromobacter deleyi]QQB33681.1 hypothetical protein I6I07_24115 [Achromobacter deleyi]
MAENDRSIQVEVIVERSFSAVKRVREAIATKTARAVGAYSCGLPPRRRRQDRRTIQIHKQNSRCLLYLLINTKMIESSHKDPAIIPDTRQAKIDPGFGLPPGGVR